LAGRRLFSIKPALTIRGRKFKGLRGFAGKPFHPPLTDIPVAAYLIVAVTDLVSYISWSRGRLDLADDFFVTGTHVIIAGGAVSVLTIATGFWDWLKSTPPGTQAWRTANWHMAIMLTMSILVAANILLRLSFWSANTRYPDNPILVLSLIIGALVTFGSIYGGSMVYDYAFNVEGDIDHAYTESEVDKIPGKTDPVQEVEGGQS
jgi:uncharacterized membrane protein